MRLQAYLYICINLYSVLVALILLRYLCELISMQTHSYLFAATILSQAGSE